MFLDKMTRINIIEEEALMKAFLFEEQVNSMLDNGELVPEDLHLHEYRKITLELISQTLNKARIGHEEIIYDNQKNKSKFDLIYDKALNKPFIAIGDFPFDFEFNGKEIQITPVLRSAMSLNKVSYENRAEYDAIGFEPYKCQNPESFISKFKNATEQSSKRITEFFSSVEKCLIEIDTNGYLTQVVRNMNSSYPTITVNIEENPNDREYFISLSGNGEHNQIEVSDLTKSSIRISYNDINGKYRSEKLDGNFDNLINNLFDKLPVCFSTYFRAEKEMLSVLPLALAYHGNTDVPQSMREKIATGSYELGSSPFLMFEYLSNECVAKFWGMSDSFSPMKLGLISHYVAKWKETDSEIKSQILEIFTDTENPRYARVQSDMLNSLSSKKDFMESLAESQSNFMLRSLEKEYANSVEVDDALEAGLYTRYTNSI